MRTFLDCIPCFYRQALEASRLAGLTETTQKQLILELSQNIEMFLSDTAPPEVARMVYDIINKHANTQDIYQKVKKQCNEFALTLYPELKKRIKEADNSLLLAAELAIAGNIIDYGAKNSLDIDDEVNNILNESSELFQIANKKIFDFVAFQNKTHQAKSILYLADNAGEVVFDKLLIETIKQVNNKVDIYYAVKAKPIINDALIEDAMQCGIDQFAAVLSSGSSLSGTILPYCTQEFLDLFYKADMVISKGQGNFEGLHDAARDIFFLFIAKCPIIANMVQGKIGNMLLFYKPTK